MHLKPILKKTSKKTSLLKLFWISLGFQTKEFFANSSLHGVRYIADEDRPFRER